MAGPVLLMYLAQSRALFVISSSAESRMGVSSQNDRRMVKGGRAGRKVVEEHIPTRSKHVLGIGDPRDDRGHDELLPVVSWS